ncbi:TIGR04002 family protein [Caproiciproducens sp. MSJ-32]|uniref:TIGR04002 family protein n=1 Tax=Caproiciproducens sp. MSJ-32 TaxID=2841527 RepID=UPI001C0F42B2|nr:TIGR04002 family protein [Caproiciproducens sp. MSJ-32]MBU5454308.1 TIGR04002 family protein [Caproiciproducens sp. MSJ-32]
MKNNIKNKTRYLVLTAVFAAFICISIVFLPRIPTGFNGGYIHLGDVLIYLAAALLSLPYGMAAAAIGGALSDIMVGAAVWALPTIIIKASMVIFFTSKEDLILSKKNKKAVIFAGITGWLGYYIAGSIIAGNFIAPLITLPIEALQPIASGIIFILIAHYLDKIKIKERVFKEYK